ncbi:LOW QUALITY PROTEIN: uncharacterized protein [Salminus brasiliensis]|uniref:LOW QUALITY PROTEIN: uncharacterized protein n=1 Tax=Salminus brasiliensis TaxID=930266 RepID=UPI003B82F60B
MDSVHCHWNGANDQQSVPKTRPIGETLSRLAVLMARMKHKQEGRSLKSQQYPSVKTAWLTTSRQHRASHTTVTIVAKIFPLASTMQLHRCPFTCQMCKGKLQWGSTCPLCLAKVLGLYGSEEQSPHFNYRLHHDSSPYACSPCGRAFWHKQELLYNQEAGGCQLLTPLSSSDAPTPSDASIPPSSSRTNDYSVTCDFCLTTFRSVQGRGSHQRLVHKNSLRKKKKVTGLAQESKGTLFPCRSCDKVFSQTSMQYLHRKEEHRRNTSIIRQPRSSVKSTQLRQKGELYPCLHCGKAVRDLKTAKLTVRPSKESKLINKRKKKVKKCLTLKTRRQKIADKEDALIQDKDGEFPCPSCEVVFKTQSALLHHEYIHQFTHTTNPCSVCTGGIALSEIAASSLNKVYDCVPCKEAYVDLDTFLQHCKIHFYRSNDEKDHAQLRD